MYIVKLVFYNGKILSLEYPSEERALEVIREYTKRPDVYCAVAGKKRMEVAVCRR